MSEEEIAIRKEKNAYMREWRRRNPEKAKEINRRYWSNRVLAKKGGSNDGKTAENANT